jgi:hypothetical protein
MSACKCSEIIYDERSDKSYLCEACDPESPFGEHTTQLLKGNMGFTVYLYKEPTSMPLEGQDYEVLFKSERGVVSIHCRDADLFAKAKSYLCTIYGEHDDLEDSLIWE